MSSYWYASSPRGAINPRLYTGDKYGEYVWSRSYDDELWEFRSEDDRDRFVKDHEKYGAKSFAANGAPNLYAPTPCGSDGYQDYPLDPNCDYNARQLQVMDFYALADLFLRIEPDLRRPGEYVFIPSESWWETREGQKKLAQGIIVYRD